MQRLGRWETLGDGESVAGLRAELAKLMEDHASVFRTEAVMQEGVDKLRRLRARVAGAR